MGIQITPSILNADFSRLGEEVGRIGSADWVHVDVMDNHFVPNLTFGPTMVEALSRATDLPLDVHLMIEDCDSNAPAYVEAGASSVTFHVEATKAPIRLAREIRAQGARASMALKPATPIEPYEALLPERLAAGERVLYLWHAEGVQRSRLERVRLGEVEATARNWTTVTALRDLTRGRRIPVCGTPRPSRRAALRALSYPVV